MFAASPIECIIHVFRFSQISEIDDVFLINLYTLFHKNYKNIKVFVCIQYI